MPNDQDLTALAKEFPIQGVGMVPFVLALRAYARYAKLYGTGQSLQRLGERGGFGLAELGFLLRGYEQRADRDPRDTEQACELATKEIAATLKAERDALKAQVAASRRGFFEVAADVHGVEP